MAKSDYAREFAAQLTGKDSSDFCTVQGDLLLRTGASKGSLQDALSLNSIDHNAFYEAEFDADRLAQVSEFLQYCGVKLPRELHRALYDALESFPQWPVLST